MKIAIGFILLTLIFVVSCVSMIMGWGVEPKSWGWIAFSYVSLLVLQTIAEIVKASD